MLSFRSVLAIAPLLATALAKVAFTSVPAIAVASNEYNITWAGGDGTPVTLTLRRGDPANLATISTIADRVSGSYYIWTVDSSLPSASDYALQITQGQSDINYSGLFTISGSSSSSTSGSYASTTRASNGTMSVTSSAATGTGTGMNRNGTFSTATLTSSSSRDYTFGASGTATGSSAGRTASSQSTSAPSNDAPVRAGSSAALILGIVAAVMLH